MSEQTRGTPTQARPEDAQSIPGEAQPLAPPVVQKRPRVGLRPLQFLSSLLALGGIVFGLVKLWAIVLTLQKEVAAALITGTFLVIGHFIVKHLERKRAIEQEIRLKKIPVYEKFIDLMFTFMKAQKFNTPMSKKESTERFIESSKEMVSWASSDVIRAWSKFVESANERSPELLFDMEQVLRAIRKDTGHPDENLRTGDLLRLFITDLKRPND